MTNLPEPVRASALERFSGPARRPAVVRAAVSPTALALAGAGVVVGLVLVHSIVVAVILGAGAWAARVLAAVITQARRDRAAEPRAAVLDPWSVPEPWRGLLTQAQDCQSRFDQSVADWPPGPIHDRLVALQPRLWNDMRDVAAVAHRGAALSGWVTGSRATGRPSAAQLAEQLRAAQSERERVEATAPERAAGLARTEQAIAAQIRASHRAAESEAAVLDRLRVIVARLDETVTSLLVLGAGGGEAEADALTASLDDIQMEIASLSSGLADATGTASGALPPLAPPSPPPTP